MCTCALYMNLSSVPAARTVSQRTSSLPAPTLHAEWSLDLVFDLTRDAAPFFSAAYAAAAQATSSAAAIAVDPPVAGKVAPADDATAPVAAAEAAALAAFLSGITLEAAVWHEGQAGGPDTKAATTATTPKGHSAGLSRRGTIPDVDAAAAAPQLLPLSTLQPFGYAPAATRTAARSAHDTSASSDWTCLGPALKSKVPPGGRASVTPAPTGQVARGARSPLVHLPLRRISAALNNAPSAEGSQSSSHGQNSGRECDVLKSLPPSVLVLGAAVFLGTDSPS